MSDERPDFGREEIELDDGRYLILYTFPVPGEQDAQPSSKVAVENVREERGET